VDVEKNPSGRALNASALGCCKLYLDERGRKKRNMPGRACVSQRTQLSFQEPGPCLLISPVLGDMGPQAFCGMATQLRGALVGGWVLSAKHPEDQSPSMYHVPSTREAGLMDFLAEHLRVSQPPACASVSL
jgi:hypothetical protein